MLLQILTATPKWVFVLFAALLWFGGAQMFARSVSLARVSAIAIGMAGFSLYGTASAFGRQPMALAAWLAGAALVSAWVLSRPLPAGTRWDGARRRFLVPGSALPLALMMGIFFTKYGVAVATAMHPQLATHASFALGCGALYGCFSGGFAARAARLWRFALAQEKALAAGALSA